MSIEAPLLLMMLIRTGIGQDEEGLALFADCGANENYNGYRPAYYNGAFTPPIYASSPTPPTDCGVDKNNGESTDLSDTDTPPIYVPSFTPPTEEGIRERIEAATQAYEAARAQLNTAKLNIGNRIHVGLSFIGMGASENLGRRDFLVRQSSEEFTRELNHIPVGVFYNPELRFYGSLHEWWGNWWAENQVFDRDKFISDRNNYFSESFAEEKENWRPVLIEQLTAQAQNFIVRLQREGVL